MPPLKVIKLSTLVKQGGGAKKEGTTYTPCTNEKCDGLCLVVFHATRQLRRIGISAVPSSLRSSLQGRLSSLRSLSSFRSLPIAFLDFTVIAIVKIIAFMKSNEWSTLSRLISHVIYSVFLLPPHFISFPVASEIRRGCDGRRGDPGTQPSSRSPRTSKRTRVGHSFGRRRRRRRKRTRDEKEEEIQEGLDAGNAANSMF